MRTEVLGKREEVPMQMSRTYECQTIKIGTVTQQTMGGGENCKETKVFDSKQTVGSKQFPSIVSGFGGGNENVMMAGRGAMGPSIAEPILNYDQQGLLLIQTNRG